MGLKVLFLFGLAFILTGQILLAQGNEFVYSQRPVEFANHVSGVPSVWKPFISIGPSSKVFNVGLLLLALNYFKEVKRGVLLIFLATLVLLHLIPVPLRLVVGYSLTLLGFGIIFLKSKAGIVSDQNTHTQKTN